MKNDNTETDLKNSADEWNKKDTAAMLAIAFATALWVFVIVSKG